jgi:hypothetical protein
MRCGHGWQQEYEIRHRVDAEGRAAVTYYVDGRRVPSPLSRPACVNCGARVLRIMRSDQIPEAAARLEGQGIAGPLMGLSVEHGEAVPIRPPVTRRAGSTAGKAGGKASRKAGGAAAPDETGAEAEERGEPAHRRHLSGLFRTFHRK